MKLLRFTFLFLLCTYYGITAAEFTVASYNCGELSDHYDYLRAAAMQKVMQERYIAEPAQMALNEKIQKVALKMLFSHDPQIKQQAQQEWNQNSYKQLSAQLIQAPTEIDSPNKSWFEKTNQVITSYKKRPVTIFDKSLLHNIMQHVADLTQKPFFSKLSNSFLEEARAVMAKRIFSSSFPFDIICLQEANYLTSINSLFPDNYKVIYSASEHSVNGIAWNTDRFELLEDVGNLLDKAYVVMLQDKETLKTVLVASGHLTGCNPYAVQIDSTTGISDSAKGDDELQAIIQQFVEHPADMMVIGMDSNVTPLHPRLRLLKKAWYQIDSENFIEPTCTNPYQVLNTIIDWIAVKGNETNKVKITNIPVSSVGLNNLYTNISDHKPIAAKIYCE